MLELPCKVVNQRERLRRRRHCQLAERSLFITVRTSRIIFCLLLLLLLLLRRALFLETLEDDEQPPLLSATMVVHWVCSFLLSRRVEALGWVQEGLMRFCLPFAAAFGDVWRPGELSVSREGVSFTLLKISPVFWLSLDLNLFPAVSVSRAFVRCIFKDVIKNTFANVAKEVEFLKKFYSTLDILYITCSHFRNPEFYSNA